MNNYGRRQSEKKFKNKSRNGSGHTLRKEGIVERDALDWNPQGYRRRDRLRDSMEELRGCSMLLIGVTGMRIRRRNNQQGH
jgi:hypothetical protein